MLIGFRYNDADESPALGYYGGDLLCRRKGKQTIDDIKVLSILSMWKPFNNSGDSSPNNKRKKLLLNIFLKILGFPFFYSFIKKSFVQIGMEKCC